MSYSLKNIVTSFQIDYHFVCLTSVADPDPVGSGLFGSAGSRIIPDPDPDPSSTKRPDVIQIFSI